MGLFNHLFGNKTDLAREIHFDSEKRLRLWQEHLANFPKRESLAKYFSFANVDNALIDRKKLDYTLVEIKSLISEDLVDIDNEEKTQDEILGDIARLLSSMKVYEVSHLTSLVIRQEAILKVLEKLYHILKAELHAIKAARKNPDKTILLKIFKLIFHEEAFINNMFKSELYPGDKFNLEDLNKLVKSVLLEERLTEDMQSAEETFVRLAVSQMNPESRHKYRRLAERVYYDLLGIAGVPFRSIEEFDVGTKKLEMSILDENLLRKLILKNKGRIKLTDEQVEWTIKAFRKSCKEGHFEELNQEFAT